MNICGEAQFYSDDIKVAGVEGSKRPPSQHPGEVVHQRPTFRYSYTTMAIRGLIITTVVRYFTELNRGLLSFVRGLVYVVGSSPINSVFQLSLCTIQVAEYQ